MPLSRELRVHTTVLVRYGESPGARRWVQPRGSGSICGVWLCSQRIRCREGWLLWARGSPRPTVHTGDELRLWPQDSHGLGLHFHPLLIRCVTMSD